MRKRVISWLLTVVMVVSMLPTSVLADTLAADQEQQIQQEQIAPVDTENTVPAEDEETQEQQEPAPETPASQMARSGGTALALAEGTVSSAKEFAEMVASGSYTLTKDIIVTDPYASDFSGTFDGNGHTVTLAISGNSDYQALFAKLAAGALVKNTMVDGEVTGTNNIGGIAGIATNATIIACANKATVAATGRYVGGLVGKGTGLTMTSCYNQGAVSSTRTRPINMGGIAGYVDGGASVENCYNTGSITGSGKNTAAVVGWNAATVKSCYYLESTYKVGSCGNGDYTDPTVPKTDAEMRSGDIVTLLGSAFMAKTGDYPALSWETPTAAVPFTIQPENAVLTINGGTYTGSTTVALPAADAPYSYTVSCPGYTQQTGSVTVTGEGNPVANPNSVSVTLEKDTSAWVNVTFNVTPTGAALTVKRGDMTVEPQSDGIYKLLKGVAYTYTAVSDDEGYEPAVGEVTPTENSTQTVALKKVQSIAVTKAPTKTEYYKGDAELDLTGMVLTVNYDGTNETRTIEGDYAAAGVTFEGFDTSEPAESKSITVSYRGKTASFAIEVKDKLQFSDFFSAISDSVTATNSTSRPFEPVQSEGCLQPASNASSYSPSTITIAAIKNVTVSFDYCGGTGYTDFYVKKGSSQLLASYYSSEWKNFSADLRIGETLTLSYGSSSGLKLKNFTVSPLYTLTIAPDQTDATVTLKDKEDKTVSGSNGVFAVKAAADYTYTVTKKGYEPATGKVTMSAENQTVNVTLVKLPVITLQFTPDDAAVTLKQGNTTVYKESADSEKGKNVYIAAKNTDYTYTVSKFGYETKTGTIKVEGGDVSKDVALTALTAYQVKFAADPADASVALTHPVGGTIAADENGAYIVYAGETYAYTVAKADYITVSGSFTAAKNDTITVTLTYAGAGWDGTTKTEPAQDESGVYLIDTAAKLAWFADAVNGGQKAINGKLTANINLNEKAWTAFGEYDYNDVPNSGFAGTLDGDRHIVSGLKSTEGLVSCLSSTGTVKNLTVIGTVSGSSHVGGIAAASSGTVENCLFDGTVTNSSNSTSAGGIVGRAFNGNRIVNCVNTGDIKNTCTSHNSTLNIGGIVGYTYGTVENCYSTGNVSARVDKDTNKGIGGIAGQVKASAVLRNCYVTGAVTGPKAGISPVVNLVASGATVENCYYLHAAGTGAAIVGTAQKTAEEMRTPEFAAEMGMHLDSGNSNGGFPVLPWQGGTPVDNADLKAAAAAANALELRGMTAADAAKKAKADWYAENVLGLYDLTDYSDKADLCKQYGIEAPGAAVTNLHDYFLTALQKHFYKELGLDAENADLLKADATGVYQLRGLTPVSGDPEEEESAQTYTGFLTLPASVTVPVDEAEKTVSLTWMADNALVNTATGALTAPAKDKVTVTLTATLQSGTATKTKTFTLCLWSENAEKAQTLEDIAAEFTRKNIAVQPLQGVGLYDETNITDAFCRLLREQGYADVADKADEITYVNGSAKANGFDDTKVKYIADNGDITYFTGDGTARQTVQYTELKFNITYAGVTKEITLRGTVGRSADDVQQLVESAAGSLNWELIRGENTNGATQSEVAGWTLYTVNDRITSNLTLPSGIAGRYDVKVQWGTRNTEWLYITNGTNGTGVGTVNRPLQPADGTPLPEKAGKFRLIARVTYDGFDDYTLAHITGDNGVEVYADVLFDATVAPFDSSVTSEMQNALAEKYQGLLRDFVDKTKPVNLDAVSDDMQMPRPALLEEKGIMSDSYNQKVTMVSRTPDVLDFNGYHAMVYRPLPGEKPVEAKYVVTITTRSSGLLLARQEFSFTIQPFTQQELDDAAAFMTKALTENAYWDGIKNKNTDKTKVTSDLYPFAEICKNEDGTLKYVRGTVNMTFDGIEADDIPGWLDTEKYRCFRSSRPSVIENELLRVHQPEYNTTVTLDSVLTYTKYAQYWEKFGINGTEESKERYKDFAQFYKQPIHIDLTVIGEKNAADPNENQTLTVKVKVDGYNKNGHTFTGISDFTFTGKANEDPTAWDAVKACLDSAKYTYTGSGAYIKSITDAAGNTLKEKGDGKSSGWMFGLAVKGGNEILPKTTLDNTYLKDGDTLRLFFTDTYIPLDPTDPTVPGTEVPGFDEAYAGAKAYIQSAVSAPVVSYLFGEWAVLGQARAKVPLSEAYIAAYYEKVVAYVKANIGSDGILRKPDDKNTPVITDNERIALALTAIGKDPANVGGKNLLAALQDKDIMKVTDTSKTDINGLVMGLLALNSRNYTSDTSWLVQAVLEQQNKDGSWSASADKKSVGDVDMTAMALQALAPYHKDSGNETVNTAVNKALQWLSDKYKGTGYTSAESCAQVVIALSALNLDANTDARFTKTVEGKTLSVLGNLLQYRVAESGGFKHQFADKAVNEMATEQALCAMAAYARFTEKANALYDMTDAACAHRFGEWKVTVAATCTKDGVSRRICSICGAVEEKPVPAAGHNFGAWTTTKEPTCTETGTEKRTCSVCSKEETRVIAALGHTPGTEMLADKDGHWNVCKVCHAVVNKTGHTYVNGIQCVCGAVKSEGGTLKRIEVSDTITVPDTLRDNEKLNSVERIKAELQLQISRKDSGNTAENTAVFDVRLMIITTVDGKQVKTPATKADLVNGRITVLLPYPEAIAANYSKYSFTVAHLVTMADCGLDVGTVEFPAVTKTASGLLVTLTGLSPVAISWTESTNHYYYNPATTPGKTDSANTADDSQMVLWLGSAVLAAAAVVVLTRKKRVSK